MIISYQLQTKQLLCQQYWHNIFIPWPERISKHFMPMDCCSLDLTVKISNEFNIMRIAVIILKYKCCFVMELCIQNMQIEWQTVYTQIHLFQVIPE